MDPKVENLTVLDDLNENSLLNILRTRFRRDMIYSNIGTILVSVNPFKPLPLYTPQQVSWCYILYRILYRKIEFWSCPAY